MNKLAELVFIPSAFRGHLASTIEFAKLLVARDDRLSITVLIIKFPLETKLAAYSDSLAASSASERIKFIDITHNNLNTKTNTFDLLNSFIENHKPHVETAVSKLIGPNNPRLAGFVVDLSCTTMIDVANEFRVPTYVFWTSTASWLGLKFHLQALRDDHGRDISTEFKKKDRISAELVSPSFINPVPIDVLPGMALDKSSSDLVLNFAKRIREAKGVVLNTFMELEPHALHHLIHEENSPAMYSVGPVLSLTGEGGHAFSGETDNQNSTDESTIIKWLNDQPPLSVIFLCFGSMGSFGEDQLKEICLALERTGFRFLWCLRHSLPNDRPAFASDFVDPKLVLPEGFLDRTVEIGKIMSWAPQVAILSHPAVGGFVSHCGWNSLLESLWFGVPVATWPLYSEQQLNAFEMVKELGLAVEIKMDYKWGFDSEIDGNHEAVLVSAQEIEVGIRRVMEGESDIRKRVREMKEKCRMAVMQGGSSHSSLGCFIGNVFDNLQ